MQIPKNGLPGGEANLDALLTALYVLLHEMLPPRVRRSGPPPQVTDAELICLAVAQVLLGYSSERHWLRAARKHVGHLFPRILDQSGYTRRLRQLGPKILEAILLVSHISDASCDRVKLIDSTPVPVAMSRETVKRSAFAGIAEYGYCASHSRYFYGFRLHLICAPCGMPIGFELAPAKSDERDVALELAEQFLKPGDVLMGDKGYRSQELEHDLALGGISLIRPDLKNEPKRFGKLGGMRQWIESIFDTLKGQLSLENHGARQLDSLISRIGRRLLGLAAAVWHNMNIGNTTRSLVAYDH
jgi:hypothetical protein